MYDIRQFRPTLYTVLILGMSAFALAAQSPGTWVIAMFFIFTNLYLVRNERFRPLPRWLANGLTMLLVLVCARDILIGGSSMAVLAIGRFLVFVQIVKLFEVRANRDYAQLLVLSLLLMVAGSISTASLLFGIMLLCYLFISLYCCLLFHLKVESDTAKSTLADSQCQVTPATLRQDQRYLSASMRKLTGLVASVSITSAVLVFLFCPRGSGGLFAGYQFRGTQALTGFSDTVQFQQVAAITQSDEKVAEVHVWQNGAPVNGTEPLLLRGITFDYYIRNQPGLPKWQWVRTFANQPNHTYAKGEIFEPEGPSSPDVMLQEIRLQPTGTRAIFAMGGVYHFVPNVSKGMAVNYFRQDHTLQSLDPIYQPLEYQVSSNGQLKGDTTADAATSSFTINEVTLPGKPVIDPKIAEFARRPEVSGSDSQGPLAARRGNTFVSALDDQIAHNIEQYLQRNFTYTLDLTDAKKILRDQDPMVAFLYDLKRGHCEYFAGAMTLMCQSLGMQARLVIGFKCDEFNTFDGGYYQVRQSHAHAWVEVLTADGLWKTFDPTSGRDAPRIASLWLKTRHFFDYLEYKWANSIVGYDGALGDTVQQSVMAKAVNAAERTQVGMINFHNFFSGDAFMTLSSRILAIVITLMILAIVGIVVYFLYDRWRLRRRAARIGLDSLPPGDQLRLARQLGFYAEMMTLLERRNISRPRHMTPMEFSTSLAYLPNQAYDTISRLTQIFYRIRFGDKQLTPTQHRHLSSTVSRLSATMRA